MSAWPRGWSILAICALQVSPLDAQGGRAPTDARTVTYRLTPGETLAVSSAPLLDLGAAATEAETFSRIVAVRRQRSGQILVATRDPIVIRVFDSAGGFVRSFGRSGQGPGEYRDISDLVVLPTDSLVVLDRIQRRISLLDPEGTYVSSLPFSPPFSTPPSNVSLQALSDGSLVIGYAAGAQSSPSPDPITISQHVARISTRGTRLDSLGTFHVGEYFVQAMPREGGAPLAFWDRAFGRRGVLLTHKDLFYAGDAAACEIRRYSKAGRLLDVHRVALPPTPLTPSMIARYRADAVAGSHPANRVVEEHRVAEMPYPTHLPCYRQALVDSKSRVWLHLYDYPRPDPGRWLVLDPRTEQARVVLLPDRFRPQEIGAAEIMGVWRDQDDVEHVRVYHLTL